MANIGTFDVPLIVDAPSGTVARIGRLTFPLRSALEDGAFRVICGEPTYAFDGPDDCGHGVAMAKTFAVRAEPCDGIAPAVVGTFTACPDCRPDLFPLDTNPGGTA